MESPLYSSMVRVIPDERFLKRPANLDRKFSWCCCGMSWQVMVLNSLIIVRVRENTALSQPAVAAIGQLAVANKSATKSAAAGIMQSHCGDQATPHTAHNIPYSADHNLSYAGIKTSRCSDQATTNAINCIRQNPPQSLKSCSSINYTWKHFSYLAQSRLRELQYSFHSRKVSTAKEIKPSKEI